MNDLNLEFSRKSSVQPSDGAIHVLVVEINIYKSYHGSASTLSAIKQEWAVCKTNYANAALAKPFFMFDMFDMFYIIQNIVLVWFYSIPAFGYVEN